MYKRAPITARTIEDLARYLEQELDKLEQYTIELETEALQFKVWHSPPPKPVDGITMAVADGTNWNPGQGAGPYFYLNNTWRPLITPSTAKVIPKATLRLTGYPPVFINTSQIVQIGKGTLRLAGFAPSVTVT
jgi:hypothetical protein